MKKLLIVFIVILFLKSNLSAQGIWNGNFEQWTNYKVDKLDGYLSSNSESFYTIKTNTISKVTDSYSGTYAIKLETKKGERDTSFGFIINGDPESGEGGVPYSQRPDSVFGFFKYNTLGTDSAILLIRFKKDGETISNNLYKIAGKQDDSFDRLGFKINYFQSGVPDSVIIGLSSANPFSQEIFYPGSFLIADKLQFSINSIIQDVPNGDFENWKSLSFDNPNQWESFNFLLSSEDTFSVYKSTDSYKGNYALKLTATAFQKEILSLVTNGNLFDNSNVQGADFYNKKDTLIGYYKYAAIEGDSAFVLLSFYKDTLPLGFEYRVLGPQSEYTMFEIPINLDSVPNKMRIDISSSSKMIAGNTLFLDEIQLKSQPLNTAIFEKNAQNFKIYPNPASSMLHVELETWKSTTASIFIYDQSSKLIYSEKTEDLLVGKNLITIPIKGLQPGLYFYQIQIGDKTISDKFICR